MDIFLSKCLNEERLQSLAKNTLNLAEVADRWQVSKEVILRGLKNRLLSCRQINTSEYHSWVKNNELAEKMKDPSFNEASLFFSGETENLSKPVITNMRWEDFYREQIQCPIWFDVEEDVGPFDNVFSSLPARLQNYAKRLPIDDRAAVKVVILRYQGLTQLQTYEALLKDEWQARAGIEMEQDSKRKHIARQQKKGLKILQESTLFSEEDLKSIKEEILKSNK